MAIAGFSDTYSERKGLDHSVGEVLDSITATLDGFADRAGGTDTDYWLALGGARKTMQSGDAPTCRMIAWFTDGKLDFTIRSSADKPYAPGVSLDTEQDRKKMVEAAKTSLCRPGGLVDQVRSSDIITVAIGLAGKDVKAADFDLLKSIATGEQTSTGTCGDCAARCPATSTSPTTSTNCCSPSTNSAPRGQPPLTNETGACAVKVCDSGKHRFVLDSSVGSVNILASADRTGLTRCWCPRTAPKRAWPVTSRAAPRWAGDDRYDFPGDKAVAVG